MWHHTSFIYLLMLHCNRILTVHTKHITYALNLQGCYITKQKCMHISLCIIPFWQDWRKHDRQKDFTLQINWGRYGSGTKKSRSVKFHLVFSLHFILLNLKKYRMLGQMVWLINAWRTQITHFIFQFCFLSFSELRKARTRGMGHYFLSLESN